MANYYATWRSNYFKVKDLDLFKKEIEPIDVEVLEKGEYVALIQGQEGDGNGIPTWYYLEEEDEEEEWDLADFFGRHLKVGSVAVLMEAGAEKVRYVHGHAQAFSWTGEEVSLSLGEIYKLAQDEFGGDAEVTLCEY